MAQFKKDGPPDAKRPHATIDLKATDLTPEAAAEAKAAADSAASASSGGATTTPTATSAATASVKSGDGASANAKANDAKAGETKIGETKTAAAPAQGSRTDDRKTAPSMAMADKAGTASSRRSLATHALAGVAGGFLVVALGDWIAPRLGIVTPTQELHERTVDLQRRMSVVEKGGSAELSAKLAEAEQRLAAIEGRAETMNSAQVQFSEETRAALDKISPDKLNAETQQRLSSLDERLAIIAKAAESGEPGSAGNIPQLAAVTGKVADLQNSLTKDIDTIRRSIPQNVEPRFGELAEKSEAARAGFQRIDGDINNLKTDSARLGQRIETLKADGDRATATVKVLQEETAQLTSGFNELKSTVVTQVKGDVGAALSPVASKISSLEQSLQNVVRSEADRKANAERIVVSLELANLKRQIESGLSYAGGLAEVRKAADGKLDLTALERFKDSGVPTVAALQSQFRPLANAVSDAASAPSEGGLIDKLVAGAKSVVRVRDLNPDPADKSADAVVARMQVALGEGQLGEVLTYAKDIPPAASGILQDWLAKVEARHAVDRAIGDIESQLKVSLTQSSAADVPSSPAPAASAPTAPTPVLPQDAPVGPSGRVQAPQTVPSANGQ